MEVKKEMDQAKAIINLKEGIIQLEGPVEFVREYLELYRPAVVKSVGAPAVPTLKKEAPTRAAAPVRRRGRRTKRFSASNAIRKEVKTGFFAEPKSSKEVYQRLIEKGITCNSNSVRMSLKRLSDKGLLAIVKTGRSVRYHSMD